MSKQRIGLWLLAVGNAFAIWSAFNPSLFTLRKFVQREGTTQDRADAQAGMILAGVTIGVMFAGVLLLTSNKQR